MAKEKQKFHHPKGLWLTNIMIAIQSYAGYALAGVGILFYTLPVEQGGLAMSKAEAGHFISIVGLIGSFAPLLGAWLTDKFLGMQRAILWGILFNSIGYGFIAYSSGHVMYLYIGMAINIIAGSFYKGNVTALVGELYSKDQVSAKDAAYSLFYMAVNIGSLIGPIIGGFVYQDWFSVKDGSGKITLYGFREGYLMIGISLFITFVLFLLLAPKWLGETAKYPVGKHKEDGKVVDHKEERQPLTKKDYNRIIAMVIIFAVASIFWTAYFQTSASVSLMTYELVNLNVFGYNIPVTWMTSYNGLLCIILAPLLGMYWVRKGQQNKDWTVGSKMGLGMIFTGLGFYIFVLGLKSLNGVVDGSVKMSLWYLIGGYTILTVGELLISPIGMALFSKLAPEKFAATAMSVWYLTYAVSGYASGELVAYTETLGYEKVLLYIAIVVIVLGVALLLIKGLLENLMGLEEVKAAAAKTTTEEKVEE